MNRKSNFYYTGIVVTIIAILTVIFSCETKPTEPKNDNIFDPLNPKTGGDPFKLTAKIAGGGITLEWNRPVFKELRFYRIYRSTEEETDYLELDTTEANQTDYVDKTVENGHNYWYRLTALNEDGKESKITNTVGVNIKTEPVLVINGNDQHVTTKEISLTILAITAQQMMVSNSDDFTGYNWESYVTSKNWTLTTGDGQKTVYMKVKYDSSESAVVTANILPQPMEPAFAIISDTTKYAPAREVQLSVSASGTNLRMKISEDSTFAGINWQTYLSTPDFQLSDGEGIKKVYAQFKNDFEIESPIVNDDIILDTTPPIIALTYFPDSGVTKETDFHFNPTESTDNLSPVEDLQFRVDYEDDGTYEMGWTFLSPVNYKYKTGGGDKTIRTQLRDGAGWKVDTLVNIFVNSRPRASTTTTMINLNYKFRHFDASASADYEDGANLEYRWDFDGDGNWETGWIMQNTISFEYEKDGDYTLKLSVRDQNFLSDEITRPVAIVLCADIDGNIYKTLNIGSQVWMAENLRVTHYRNGDPIPNVDITIWENLTHGAICSVGGDTTNVETYGLLYNWYAVDDSRNIAPTGWHIATDEEWKQLEIYLGMSISDANNTGGLRGTDEGSKLKATTGWSHNGNGTNESGFMALPGGFCYSYFNGIGNFGYWWTSTDANNAGYGNHRAWFRYLMHYNSSTGRDNIPMQYGHSVRCIRD